MTTKKKVYFTVGVVVAAVVLWLLLAPSKNGSIELETAFAERISISNSVMATGTVEPVTEVEVGTQVSGIIDRLYVDYNDIVTAGQVIAEMDKVTLQADLESSQAQLESSKTEYEYRLKQYERTKELHQKGLVSDTDYEDAEYLYKTALNAYNRSKADIVAVRRNLGYATITSPINGVVISRAVEEGQTVAAGFETPTLFTIAADLTQMEVIADVDEADIGQVEEGQRVEFTVDAYPDDVFVGQVQQVRLEATTESSVVTYEVVISAHNPDLKLKPGLTANVTIYTLEKQNVLAVPTKALRFMPNNELLSKIGYFVVAEGRGAAPAGAPAGAMPAGGAQGNLPAGAAPISQLSGNSSRQLWVKENKTLKLYTVKTGAAGGDMTEIVEGITDGAEVATAIEVTQKSKAQSVERSPFMPAGPGGNNRNRD